MGRRRLMVVIVAAGVVGLFGWAGVNAFRSGHDRPTTTGAAPGITATTVLESPSASPAIATSTSTTVATVASSSDTLADSERREDQVTSTTIADVAAGPVGEVTLQRETVEFIGQLIDYLADNPASAVPFRPVPDRKPLSEELPVPVEVPLDWDGEPVEFRVLAVDPLEGGFAVVDLADLVMRVYDREYDPSWWHAITVSAFTRRGDVLVSSHGSPRVSVVPGGDFSVRPSIIYPSRWVDERRRQVAALADQSGERVWLLQRTPSDTTLVDLVSIEDNTVVLTVEIDGSYFISGLLEDDLYVVRGGEDRDDLAVSPSGTVRKAASCRDYAEDFGDLSTVGVFGRNSACVTLDGRQHLVFYNGTTGQVDVVKASGSGRWSRVILPEIPAANTTGQHSDQVLIQLQVPDATIPSYSVTKAIYVADLSDNAVRLVHGYEEGRYGSPLGIVDGLLIVKAGIEGENSIVVIDIESGESQTVVDLPDGYFVYDAA